MNDENMLYSLWTVSAVVLGFQIAALAWRLKRELEMEEAGKPTWIPIPDAMVFLSMLILVGGVFLAPILGDIDANLTLRLFGLSLVILASTPVVLAGHYDLFRRKKGCRGWVTTQEKWALTVPALFGSAYGIAWWQL